MLGNCLKWRYIWQGLITVGFLEEEVFFTKVLVQVEVRRTGNPDETVQIVPNICERNITVVRLFSISGAYVKEMHTSTREAWTVVIHYPASSHETENKPS